MADQKLTDRTLFGGTLNILDLIHVVDVSDTTQNPAGSSYKLKLDDLKDFINENIYNTDGTLTSNRVVAQNAFSLEFANGEVYINESLGIGTTSPTAKLHVVGIDNLVTTNGFLLENNAGTDIIRATNDLGIRLSNEAYIFTNYGQVYFGGSVSSTFGQLTLRNSSNTEIANFQISSSSLLFDSGDTFFRNLVGGTQMFKEVSTGNFAIGTAFTSPTARLHILGSGSTSATYSLKIDNSSSTPLFRVSDDGHASMNFATTTGSTLFFLYGAGTSTGLLAYGDDVGINGIGVAGFSIGVLGNATTGYAVNGVATTGRGCYGQASTGLGIAGEVTTATGTAVYGGNANGSKISLFEQVGTLLATNSNINTNIIRTIDLNGFDMTGTLLNVSDTTASTGNLITVLKQSVASFKVRSDRATNLGQFTASQASALTAEDADIIYVNSTNGTFTSVGFWGYENGTWIKL